MGVGSSNRKNQWQARILVHGKARARARPAGHARGRPPHACAPGCHHVCAHSRRAARGLPVPADAAAGIGRPVIVMDRVG